VLIRRLRRTNTIPPARPTGRTSVEAKKADAFTSRNRQTQPNSGGVKNPAVIRRQAVTTTAAKTGCGIAFVVVGDDDEFGSRNGLKCLNCDNVIDPLKCPNNGGARNPVVIGTEGAKGATAVAAKTGGCVTSVVVGAQNGDAFISRNGLKCQNYSSVMNPTVSWAASKELGPNERWVIRYPYYTSTRP